jgi:hypothetical protein
VVARSHELGAQFIDACRSGKIAEHIVPL